MIFPVLHGTYGEDGTVQGLLELADAAYVGAGPLGSGIGMDKDVAKRLLAQAGIPVVPWRLVTAAGFRKDPAGAQARVSELGFPAVRETRERRVLGGRQQGEGAAPTCRRRWRRRCRSTSRRWPRPAVDAREIECAVLGNDDPQAAVPGEIEVTHKDGFYSYEAKYVDPDGSHIRIPADIPAETAARVRQLSVETFRTLELAGMARVDFFLDRQTGALYVNEVNTIPGLHRHLDVPEDVGGGRPVDPGAGDEADRPGHRAPPGPPQPEDQRVKRYWLITLGLLAVFLAAFGVVEALGVPLLQQPEDWLGARRAGARRRCRWALLVADVFLPIPSSVIMIANGALFGIAAGTALSLVGSLGATALGFLIGRRSSRLITRLVTPAEKARADALLARWGAMAIVITRPIPLLAETTAILAGASPLGWGRSMAAAVGGALPSCLLYALTGATSRSFGSGVAMFACVLAVAGAFYFLGRRAPASARLTVVVLYRYGDRILGVALQFLQSQTM